MEPSPFLYMTCQPGAEKLLKLDTQRAHPELKFAFSRPGLVTFKSEKLLPLNVSRPSVFARTYGLSYGNFPSLDAAVAACPEEFLLQAFCRDETPIDDPRHDAWARDAELAARIAEISGRQANSSQPKRGQGVATIIEVDPGKFLLGGHRHDFPHRPTPAGRPPQWTPPANAPSRVWGKVSEAIWRTGQTVDASSFVLDIGCAPGGGTAVLLNAGAKVLGVDPADMAPEILNHPNFEHRRAAVEILKPAELPRGINGIVYDVNLAPKMMLGSVAKLLKEISTLKWGFFTLKLNNQNSLDELPWMLGKIKESGFQDVFVEQLFYNRQELFCWAKKKP